MYENAIILPRQARDKHIIRESALEKETVFSLQALAACLTRCGGVKTLLFWLFCLFLSFLSSRLYSCLARTLPICCEFGN
jgi:preprotein translocase subunit SecG